MADKQNGTHLVGDFSQSSTRGPAESSVLEPNQLVTPTPHRRSTARPPRPSGGPVRLSPLDRNQLSTSGFSPTSTTDPFQMFTSGFFQSFNSGLTPASTSRPSQASTPRPSLGNVIRESPLIARAVASRGKCGICDKDFKKNHKPAELRCGHYASFQCTHNHIGIPPVLGPNKCLKCERGETLDNNTIGPTQPISQPETPHRTPQRIATRPAQPQTAATEATIDPYVLLLQPTSQSQSPHDTPQDIGARFAPLEPRDSQTEIESVRPSPHSSSTTRAETPTVYCRPYSSFRNDLPLMEYLTIPHDHIEPQGVRGEWPYQFPAIKMTHLKRFTDEAFKLLASSVVRGRERFLKENGVPEHLECNSSEIRGHAEYRCRVVEEKLRSLGRMEAELEERYVVC
ncbi:hypothetical protein CC86DRAFT_380023 [Ophiobolus disseminans]|uniref:Uncharacterized protein n=1 Tax=Ophiobolus disseminans TaxID=1469910 RepID=A0A6A7A807_9PLEO|nr:hypothetical protein CC86DRAFT_380023 [Ophiobolus disseminans]